MLSFSLLLSACTHDFSIDVPSNFDWTYAPHFQWTFDGVDAELVCMQDALQKRLDILSARSEQISYATQHTFTDAEMQEFERLNALGFELVLLTQIYINPSFTDNPDEIVSVQLERGTISCIDEFNVRRANFNPPANMPYITMTRPASGYWWDIFMILVSHTPTRTHVEFILDFLDITGESVYIVVDPGSFTNDSPLNPPPRP